MQKNINYLPTRRFGRTEINIPVLSLGGMRFQHSWSDVEIGNIPADSQSKVENILRTATAMGFHHCETARHYGTSEVQLGYAMKKVLDDNRIIQTKIPPNEDPIIFEKELKLSFSKLQCKKIDLLAIHGLNLPEHLEQTIRPGGCLDVVRKWQAIGLIDKVGFSTHGSKDLIVRAIETDQFDYVNLHWYFIFQDNEPALEAAAKYDLGVFIISPTDKGGHLHTPSAKLRQLCAPLHPILFNDLFCLSDPRVHTISVGVSNPVDLNLHVQAVKMLHEAESILPKLINRLNSAAILTLGQEWMNSWSHGLPSWEKTPGCINVPVLIWLYNLYKSWDMYDYVKARYGLLGNGSHWFPGANADCLGVDVGENELKDVLYLSPWKNEILLRLYELKEQFQGKTSKRLTID